MTAADVVLGLVRASVTLGQPTDAPVYDAHVPDDPPFRYVVVYPSTALRSAEDLAHTSDMHYLEWRITCVGSTRAEVEWLATRTRDALVDVKPTVPGLSCGAVEQTDAQPIRPDTNIPGRVVLYSTDGYQMHACTA